MKKIVLFIALFFLLVIGLTIGGEDPKVDPLTELIEALKPVKNASIILADTKEEGVFFSDYYQKFLLLEALPSSNGATKGKLNRFTTDWMPVSESLYQKRKKLVGMTLYSKKDDKADTTVAPAGYEYVGDERYGRWHTDSSGNRFWTFLGQYYLLSAIMGNRGIGYNDYNRYRTYRGTGSTTYGKGKASVPPPVPKASSDFFSRRMERQTQSSSSFANKVNQRVGRSSVSVRHRSSSVGK